MPPFFSKAYLNHGVIKYPLSNLETLKNEESGVVDGVDDDDGIVCAERQAVRDV